MIEAEEYKTGHAVFRHDFEAFYSRELNSVVGLAYVLSGSRTGAEDLAQEAFTAAFRDWDRIGAYEKPGAWVRRVVVNRSVSRFRRLAAETRALVRLERGDYTVPEIEQDAREVWDAVRSLPTRQAQAIALRFYDRQSIADIARILDLSENTIKTHLQRGKQALAARLGEEESA
jgi:RNA polymerase sigma-70 factor (ECF subfamily)